MFHLYQLGGRLSCQHIVDEVRMKEIIWRMLRYMKGDYYGRKQNGMKSK
jgi:hypothetical protein